MAKSAGGGGRRGRGGQVIGTQRFNPAQVRNIASNSLQKGKPVVVSGRDGISTLKWNESKGELSITRNGKTVKQSRIITSIGLQKTLDGLGVTRINNIADLGLAR